MPPHRPSRALALLLAASAAALAARPAHALRIVNYNVLNYSSTSGGRNPHFRTILGPLGADVVVVQEMTGSGNSGVDLFRDDVLNVLEPGQWASAPFVNGNDTDNALFYKTSAVQLLGSWAFYPSPATSLRLVSVYRLKPVGYASHAAEVRIFSCHLKASQGFETDRLNEAIGIRDSMNAMPPGTHGIVLGDFNIYSGAEPAFLKLKEDQADDDGRVYDPLNAPAITWNTAGLAAIHTQSPCNGAGCANGAATGGLDDRFDMFLPTLNLGDGEGLDLLAGTYVPVGNDGLHYNLAITDAPTIPEGAGYATALISASDHLPLRVDLQVPPRSAAPAALGFGILIVGASEQQSLQVSNVATPPADELDYALAAPAGFGAPAGPFQAQAGASNDHAVTIDAGSPGVRSGNLVVSSDDPENLMRTVALSGTVLDHAVPSLDSMVALTAATLDFGIHDAGEFADRSVRVHNLGYDALQSGLSVFNASIVGGAGRFSLVGGFLPSVLYGVGQTYVVHFDDAGATTDSAYTATLTLYSSDEDYAGATVGPPLTVSLVAEVSGGAVGVGPRVPGFTRLLPAQPNPARGQVQLGFDLATPAEASLVLYDLRGRSVRTLAEGHAAGSYRFAWDGRGADGVRVPAGIYFLRLTVRGQAQQTARLVLLD